MNVLDICFTVFMALNVAFLLGTAIWFRVVHSLKRNRYRFEESDNDTIEELQWNYSLRSNLLLSTIALSIYLLAIGEVLFLLVFYSVGGLLNIATDILFVYDVKLFPIARRGHLGAGVVCIIALCVYVGIRFGVN